MKYPHIKESKLSHSKIAKAFGFKTIKSFRCSSAHKRYMQGIESILEFIKTNKNNQHGPTDKA